MKKLVALVMMVAMLVAAFGVSMAEEPTYFFRLAENQPTNNPVTEGDIKFAELVKERTNGQVVIEVYSDGQLGQEAEVVDQIRAGMLEIARVNTNSVCDIATMMRVCALPYVFASREQKYAALDGAVGEKLNANMAEYGMINLGWIDAGSRCFYTSYPAAGLADLKGKKIRVMQAQLSIDMVEALGATATPLAQSETYTAMQTGVIDGAENDYVTWYTSGHNEVAPYYMTDGHTMAPAVLIFSTDAWNSLTPELQAIVQECATEAILWQRDAMEAFQGESRTEAEKLGAVVTELSPEAIAEFQAAVSPMYDAYPELKDLIAEIQAY